ncbi:MAG: hypothetical protein AB1778_05820 [Candidatus Bipolaricaulota bacterium]
MKTIHRGYSEERGDFRRLERFVTTHRDALRTHSTWCLGRLVDWRYLVFDHKEPIERFCEENAELWFDGAGELSAVAISEDGGGEFAVLLAGDSRDLFAEILDWACTTWGGRATSQAMEVTEN